LEIQGRKRHRDLCPFGPPAAVLSFTMVTCSVRESDVRGRSSDALLRAPEYGSPTRLREYSDQRRSVQRFGALIHIESNCENTRRDWEKSVQIQKESAQRLIRPAIDHPHHNTTNLCSSQDNTLSLDPAITCFLCAWTTSLLVAVACACSYCGPEQRWSGTRP